VTRSDLERVLLDAARARGGPHPVGDGVADIATHATNRLRCFRVLDAGHTHSARRLEAWLATYAHMQTMKEDSQ
jgi:hypothetical protein